MKFSIVHVNHPTRDYNIKFVLFKVKFILSFTIKLGIDYDKIPGCGQKAVLLKAGAEHLAEIMGFRTTIAVINRVEDFTQKFVLYEVQISVLNG